MRELYAVQLDLQMSVESASPTRLSQEWVARGAGTTPEEVQEASGGTLRTATGHELEFALEPEAADGWTCSWRRTDDHDPGLIWRLLLACGHAPGDTEVVRASLRVRLERAADDFKLVPPGHEFRAPAIVRTLLREHSMFDADVRVEPRFRERRASEVPELVRLLRDPRRRLPVFVVSRSPDAEHTVDAGELARQVAGLAHVEVLSTHLAAMALVDILGRELSVWGGAVRLYWPGFSTDDNPRRHRLWVRARLLRERDFVGTSLRFLGSLGSVTVPEHPIVAAARLQRRNRAVQTGGLPDWVVEYIDSLESDAKDAKDQSAELRRDLEESQAARADLESQLEDTRRAFKTFNEHQNLEAVEEQLDLDELDVASAYKLAHTEAPDYVVYLPEVEESIQEFSSYQSPRRLYEALTAVADAASAWRNGGLGSGFGDFFSSRGYEYSSNNPAANARKTKRHYQRRVDGVVVTMEPHLKVDQSTSPDQCLRVYWYRDESSQKLFVGHVGRHLPD